MSSNTSLAISPERRRCHSGVSAPLSPSEGRYGGIASHRFAKDKLELRHISSAQRGDIMDDRDKGPGDKSKETSNKLDEALKNLDEFNKKTKELIEKSTPRPKPTK
jgi:hypothetical protein